MGRRLLPPPPPFSTRSPRAEKINKNEKKRSVAYHVICTCSFRAPVEPTELLVRETGSADVGVMFWSEDSARTRNRDSVFFILIVSFFSYLRRTVKVNAIYIYMLVFITRAESEYLFGLCHYNLTSGCADSLNT